MATIKLFKLLEQAEAAVDISNLYLPTQLGVMTPSGDVWIIDNENAARQGFAKQLPLLPPLAMEIGSSNVVIASNAQLEAVKKLHESLRPRPLSAEIAEVLDESCLHAVVPVRLAEVLQEKLASADLHMCLLSLKKYSETRSADDVDTLLSQVADALACFEFIGLAQIETRFVRNGEAVGTARVRSYHISERENPRRISVYISQEMTSEMGLLMRVSDCIMRQPFFQDCGPFEMRLYGLLNTPIVDIMDAFSEFNIPLYGSLKSASSAVPDPGDFVPPQYLPMLEMSFARLRPGDYVAYLIDDPFLQDVSSGDVDETYIFVKVTKVILPDDELNASPMLYQYEVNVGKADKVTVPSLDLYRFKEYKLTELVEPDEAPDVTALQVFGGNASGGSNPISSRSGARVAPRASGERRLADEDPQTLEEIKRYIKKLLVEARAERFDDVRRKKLIKRLYVKFHPDKNPHRVSIATKACQYLQRLSDRLESGEDIKDDNDPQNDSGECSFHAQH